MEIVNYISIQSEQEKEINNDEESCSMQRVVNQHNNLIVLQSTILFHRS